jgi:hypothetical protein
MATSVTKDMTQKLSNKYKPTDMTIHWKALEEHFLMVPFVFRFNNFQGKMHFLNFSKKNSVLKYSHKMLICSLGSYITLIIHPCVILCTVHCSVVLRCSNAAWHQSPGIRLSGPLMLCHSLRLRIGLEMFHQKGDTDQKFTKFTKYDQ